VPNAHNQCALALSKVSLFSGLSEREFSFLLERVSSRKYSAGVIVFSEGESCVGLFAVESGSVRIFKSSSGGREQVLSIEGPGGSVAELPVFDGGNYPASVVAVEDTVLLFVSKQHFRALCLAHPAVALKVLKVVGGRLRRLVASSRNSRSRRFGSVWAHTCCAWHKRAEELHRVSKLRCRQTIRNWPHRSEGIVSIDARSSSAM
jgi:CRP-like cAMP-binding protein